MNNYDVVIVGAGPSGLFAAERLSQEDYKVLVIDKKTGVIVIGEDIVIQECSISTSFEQVSVGTNNESNFQLKSQTVGELVKSLNDIGLSTNEIIALIESIHKIGAINAKLILL